MGLLTRSPITISAYTDMNRRRLCSLSETSHITPPPLSILRHLSTRSQQLSESLPTRPDPEQCRRFLRRLFPTYSADYRSSLCYASGAHPSTYAVIDDPYFTKLHLKCSAQTNSNQSLIVTVSPISSLDLHSLERAVEIDHPLKTPQCKTEVIGCCNGLVCLFNSHDEIVLWNMSTRKHHRLPYTEINFPNKTAAILHQVAYGFGYDPVHDDYKLLRIVRFRPTSGSEVMVYGLKSNSWKRVGGFIYDFLSRRSMGLFASGALHWMATVDLPAGNYWLISAFDLAAEKFRVVPSPPEASDSTPSVQLGMGVWESRICVIRNHIGERTDMWVLKQDEVGGSWVKLLSASEPQVTRSGSVMPIAYLPNGNELLLLQDCNKFLKYDLKSNKAENPMIHGLPSKSFDAMPYVGSLVKPSPMVKGDNETAGKGKKKAPKRDDFLSAGFKLVL